MPDHRGKLIVVSGPSGAGKSTVISRVMQRRHDLCFSVSATTRDPRPGEVNGVDYFFVTWDEFDRMIGEDELLEHAEYVTNCYGTPRAYVEQRLNEGMNVVLDIEVLGARQVRKKMPGAVLIFIAPPSLIELERRLRGRGTDTEEAVQGRLARARQEYQEADFYDYLIVNDDAEKAAKQLGAIIEAEHCRFTDWADWLKSN